MAAGGLASWLAGAGGAAKREARELANTLGEVIFCLCVPVMWILVVWGLLGDGVMTSLPTGFVDMDNTEQSRNIGRAISASRVFGLVSFASVEEAKREMRSGNIYGVMVIPPEYSRDMASGRGSSVTLYVDQTRFAVAGTLQFEASNALTALGMESTLRTSFLTGNGVSGAGRITDIVHFDYYALGNVEGSFLAFLGGALIPGVIMVSAMLGFVTAIVREDWNSANGRWLMAANGSPSAALLGKLSLHFGLYCLVFLFYLALFAGQGGFAPAGSLLLWFCVGAICLMSFAAMAVLFGAIAPNWRTALVIASGYAAPALPFTGFSIPLDAMGEYVQAFSLFLPLTWFIEGQAQQWILDADLARMGPTLAAQLALVIFPLVPGLYLFAKKLRKKAAMEGGQA